MRVLVCGSRHFKNKELMEDALREIPIPITTVIHGMARGANQIPVLEYPALWETYGRRAGPIRNAQMLRDGEPNFVAAFRGPNSRGTQNMIDQSIKAGLEVRIIDFV